MAFFWLWPTPLVALHLVIYSSQTNDRRDPGTVSLDFKFNFTSETVLLKFLAFGLLLLLLLLTGAREGAKGARKFVKCLLIIFKKILQPNEQR